MDLPLTVNSTVTTSPVISSFSCMGLCTQAEWTYVEFQFTATVYMSMAARLSNLDDQKPGINIQTESHTLTPPSGWNGPEDSDAFGSTPSWCLARKPTPDQSETWYCLEIQVISTEDERAIPPPPHTWQALIMEDMVQDGKAGLTEAVLTTPGQTILFYGQQSLWEGLSLGEAHNAMFTLSDTTGCVGKQAQLSTKAVSLGDGQQLITQAITRGHIEPREPSCPNSIPPASSPFNFHNQDSYPWPANLSAAAEWWEMPRLGPQPVHQEWGWAPQWGLDQGQRQWELWVVPPQSPLLSSDHGFKSDRSSASTSSSVSSMSERLGGSRHSNHGQWPHRESVGHMKVNLPVFKDKDAITYQSWCWDLTVYHCTGCQDHTLLPYIVCSLQGYLGELVRSLGMDITLDDVLTILDEYNNNVKALDALNQGLFQLCMGEKETIMDWQVGTGPVETPPGSCGIIPRMFSSRPCSLAKAWPFLWWTP